MKLYWFYYKTPSFGWIRSATFLSRDDMLDVASVALHGGFSVKFDRKLHSRGIK